MTLGVWHGIVMVLSFVWLVFVGIFTIGVMPMAWEEESRLCTDTTSLVRDFEIKERQELRSKGGEPQTPLILRPPDVWCSKERARTTIAELQTSYKEKIDFSRVETEYKRRLGQLWPMRIRIGLFGLAVWLIPIGLIYLPAFAISWVVTGGFRGTGHK